MAKIFYKDGVVVEASADEVRKIFSSISLPKDKPVVSPKGYRTCNDCGKSKRLALFVRHVHGKGGYANKCSECNRNYQRDWSRKNKAKIARRLEKRRQEAEKEAETTSDGRVEVPVNQG